MDNCLILLTNYFPFHKGEEYLESEINFLASRFKKIYILSTMVTNKMPQTRQVPKNVVVYPSGLNHNLLGKINMFLSQYKEVVFDKSKRNIISKEAKGRILRKLYCYYFESRSMEVYNKIKKILNEIDFSIYRSVTIYSYWLYVTARVAIELKNNFFNNKKTYVISRAHRYDLYEQNAPLKYLPEREFLLKNLDEIYPVSEDGVNYLKAKYPEFCGKIKVQRLGTFSTSTTSHYGKDKLYIVSCSIVRKVKRLNLLVEALKELEIRNIPYQWTHIGDGPEFKTILRLAQKKLNMKNVKFIGYLKNHEVINWYKKNPATVFVNLSYSEGIPVSIMEAMSMNIPIIATDVGGTREIVENNKNGFLLSRDCTIEEIVNSLIKFNQMNEQEYSNFRSNSYKIWQLKCNAHKLYSDFANMLSNRN